MMENRLTLVEVVINIRAQTTKAMWPLRLWITRSGPWALTAPRNFRGVGRTAYAIIQANPFRSLTTRFHKFSVNMF